MKYKLAVFDMDGTLADTSEGILNCHRYAHKVMGRPEPRDEELDGVIGGPLLETYKTRFGFPEEDAKQAVKIYRERYAEQGIYEAKLYDGMKETLQQLKASGVKLAVATLKAERFAKIMLANMGVADLFDAIYGVDENDKRTKAELIQMCMDTLQVEKSETVMIGDSIHDLNGAKECNVDFIGVTYGFGFKMPMNGSLGLFCIIPDDLLKAISFKNKNMIFSK